MSRMASCIRAPLFMTLNAVFLLAIVVDEIPENTNFAFADSTAQFLRGLGQAH